MLDIAVDIGNSRMKWGRCTPAGIAAVVSLPTDTPEVWSAQLTEWGLTGPVTWAAASVHPARRAVFLSWIIERREAVCVLENHVQLPLSIRVERPESVGMDRLLDAVGANARRRPDHAAIIVDAGTAVTVDLVDAGGAFRGGFILPGLRLMGRALNDHTAQLPLVADFTTIGSIPPGNTEDAIREGARWALAGGVERLSRLLAEHEGGYDRTDLLFTGGDAAVLRACLSAGEVCPSLTLEGIRLAAEAQQ